MRTRTVEIEEKFNMNLSKEDLKRIEEGRKKKGLNKSEFIRQAIRNEKPLAEALALTQKTQKQYARLLGTLEKMQMQNIRPELYDEVIEGVLEKMGEQFKRTRHQVIAALLTDHIARDMAYVAVYPGEEIIQPALNSILEDKDLFNLLHTQYIQLMKAYKEEGKKMPVPSIN